MSLRANIEYNKRRQDPSINFRSSFILFVIICLLPLSLLGQSRQDLEKQRLQLQKEIKEINTLLFQSQKKEKTLLSDLSDLVQ